jgi:hypothetical protein
MWKQRTRITSNSFRNDRIAQPGRACATSGLVIAESKKVIALFETLDVDLLRLLGSKADGRLSNEILVVGR